jgi:nucleolar complex protein 3
MASRPSKRRRVTPPPEDEPSSGKDDARAQKQFFKSAANWNLEQSYELKTRKAKKKDAKKISNEGKLPVKTAQGTWEVHEDADPVVSDAEWLESEGDDGVVEEEPEAEPEAPKIPERDQIRKAQEELAKIATQLNEEPEEYPAAFKALARIGDSPIPAIQKLCIVTQMTVYKDVIPGSRIRPATEEAEKLSKDVKRLRTYEQALVSGYNGYIKTLARHAAATAATEGRTRKGGQSVTSIAFTCACTLVNAVPHFNFRGDLLRILVRKLSSRNLDDNFVKCRQALEELFRDDEEGNATMEAVSLLTKMMKAREYWIDESVLNMLLHLRLLSEFAGKASYDSVSRPGDLPNGRKPKGKKEFRTKRERKLLKEQKEADKVMAHADAAVSHEEREKMQSEILKMVFATYFRTLKARVPHLMGAVLEGLAKYAHLINQDFFGDLLEALKDLIRDSHSSEQNADGETNGDQEDDELSVIRDTSREGLLCTVTAFALLEGQDAHNARSDLHLDLSFFITNLYRSLLSLSVNPDLELGAKSLHLADPNDTSAESNPASRQNNKINLQTTTVLLMRCLSGVLLPPWNIRSVPPLRLAAFSKQLMSVALQLPEKSCQAVLGMLHDVVHTHGRKINALWNTEERKGDGTFKPMAQTVEGSNPFTTTVWEGELLRKHYCPKVREELKAMEKALKGI